MSRFSKFLLLLVSLCSLVSIAHATTLKTEHPAYAPGEDISVKLAWTQAAPASWQLVLVPADSPHARTGADLFTNYYWMSSPYAGAETALTIGFAPFDGTGHFDLWLVDIPPPSNGDQDPFAAPVSVLASTRLTIEVALAAFDPLETLADTLISEGNPQNTAVTRVPYTTDPAIITEWQAFLKASYELSEDQWQALIEEFFGTGTERRYDRWAAFPAFVDSRALSQVRLEHIDQQIEAMTQLLFVPSDLAERVKTDYATERLSPGLGEPYQSDFLIYALETLNAPPLRDLLPPQAQRLLQSPAEREAEDQTPTIRDWQSGDRRARCTYSDVLIRMKAASPRFAMTWEMYMGGATALPFVNLPAAGAPIGPQGAGIAIKRMNLHRAVLAAVDECKKTIR